MDLERLSVVLRPRGWAEAIDLGFRMARRWWLPTVGPWLVVTVPLPALGFVFFYEHPALVFFVVWWLKPLFERVPLFVLSRALFGVVPGPRETLRALLGLWRRGAPADLTIGRIDPLRSFHMPVRDLEGLAGRPLAVRRALLRRPLVSEAITLTLWCAACELFLALTPLALLLLLLPDVRATEAIAAAIFEEQDPAWMLRLAWLAFAGWLAASAVIGPFYVAGGFGLYVTRRTRLEAWDIEVAFRRMARRLVAARGGRSAAAWLVVVALVGLAAPAAVEASPAPAGAAAPAETAEDAALREALDSILADPVFGRVRHEPYRRLRGGVDDDPGAFLGLVGVGAWLATVFSRLLWVALALLVVYFVVRLARDARGLAPPRDDPASAVAPVAVLGLDVRPSSVPADVPAEARGLWESGRRAAAVRLLYRAALARLVADGLPLRDSATEGDCLRLARRDRGEVAAYFGRLTGEWLRTAYGHRDPAPDAGVELIEGWHASFGAPR